MEFIKYPKTLHLEGSKFVSVGCAKRDAAILTKQRLSVSENDYLVIEEKMDGSQLGIYFSASGCLQFQSRGTLLSGGAVETEFSCAKNWAYEHYDKLWGLLSSRYILFGEWLYLKHTIFYDCLPSYFMEYDIYDRHNRYFLSTAARARSLAAFPFINSVRILAQGHCYNNAQQLAACIGPSAFVSINANSNLFTVSDQYGMLRESVLKQTDTTGYMEGLYIKVENKSRVLKRYKFIRADFIQTILRSKTHWKNRQKITNQLAD